MVVYFLGLLLDYLDRLKSKKKEKYLYIYLKKELSEAYEIPNLIVELVNVSFYCIKTIKGDGLPDYRNLEKSKVISRSDPYQRSQGYW